MTAYCILLFYVIFIPTSCNTIPVKTSHGIPSTHHENAHRRIGMLSSVLDSFSTPTPSTTTPHTPTPDRPTYHGYALRCFMCGRAFRSIEDIKKHYVDEHKADATAIQAPGKFLYNIRNSFISFFSKYF